MEAKKYIMANIFERMKILQRIELENIVVYDFVNLYELKATQIYLNFADNEVYVSIDNGEDVPLEKLSYNELIAIYDKLV
jgi:hypothetical protein